ncbi:MAG: DNA repair protein RadC [Desulfobacterales bacterium]|jgi:DNA repair protein RadC|nr:DNA repair protein RadC [Desulfobacterales bacterium]
MAEKNKHKGEGHRERLRYKFLASGLSGFHDYEVIELLLTLGTPRKDCKEAAKAALAKFKTLQGVLDASAVDLCSVKGIGPMNLFGIRLVKAVADRYLQKKVIRKEPLSNSKALFDYLYLNMSTKDRECFKALFLDAKNRVIAVEDLFCGTLTASSVYPREVVRAALDHKAAAVIFAHNHPSGDPSPSPADISITRQLVFACQTMGIVVHEHIVIGDSRYFSFADQGVIAEINQEFKRAGTTISYDRGNPTP